MGFCCRMSDVDQPSGDHSVDSAQHSAAGPVPALHTLAEYMRLIPPNAPTYSGEPETTPFREWTMLTLGWMRSYQVPDQYRVDLAQTLLRGTALYHWHHREELLGHERDWDAFTADLAGFFDEVDRRTVWNRRAGSFSQHPGETIRAYTDRFYGVIVGTYPFADDPDLLFMQTYSRGVHPYFQLPDPRPAFDTLLSMIQAYQDHADSLHPEPEPDPIAAPDPAPAAHDQFPQMPPEFADMDDDSSDSSHDSGYDPESESDMDIESDASDIVPDPDHDG